MHLFLKYFYRNISFVQNVLHLKTDELILVLAIWIAGGRLLHIHRMEQSGWHFLCLGNMRQENRPRLRYSPASNCLICLNL